jgi:hypothetical protein
MPPLDQASHQRACGQQVRHRSQGRRLIGGAVPGRIGPGLGDQPLAAIRQHHQQLQPTVPAHPAQHPQ